MIQFKYAHTENKEVISVSELTKKTKFGKYFCINCGKELIPKLGEFRKNHFAHFTKVECSFESYIHKLAKEKFYKTYTDCLNTKIPYYLEFEAEETCSHCKQYNDRLSECKFTAFKKCNLIDEYEVIKIQKKDGNIIPDIMLKSKNDTIHIEFAYTHKIENSESRKEKTIEFLLKDEDDIDLITKKNIPISKSFDRNSKIRNYNFQLQTSVTNSHKENCNRYFDSVHIYNNEKFEHSLETIHEFETKFNNQSIVFSKLIKPNLTGRKSYNLYTSLLTSAFNEIKQIRNCDLCIDGNFNFCNHFKKSIIPDDALTCKSYSIK